MFSVDFYSAPQCSHCKRCASYSNSVRMSVRLSHTGIVSKRLHVARCFVTNLKNGPTGDIFIPHFNYSKHAVETGLSK